MPLNDLGKLQLDSNNLSDYIMHVMAQNPTAQDNFEKFNSRVEEVNGQLSPEELKSILKVIDAPLRTQKKEIPPLSLLTREIKDLEALDKNLSKLHDLTPKLKGFFSFFNPEARALEKQYSTLKETLRNRLCETYKKALIQLESPDKPGLYQLELCKARATLQNELTSPHRSNFFSSQLEKSKAAFFNQFTKITPEDVLGKLDDVIERFIENPKETIGELDAMAIRFNDEQTKDYSGKQYVLDRFIYAETSKNTDKFSEAKDFLRRLGNMPDSEIILNTTEKRLMVFSDQKVLDDFYNEPDYESNAFKMKALLGKIYVKKSPAEADTYLQYLFSQRNQAPTLSQGEVLAKRQNFVNFFNALSLEGVIPKGIRLPKAVLNSGQIDFERQEVSSPKLTSKNLRKAQEDYFFETCIANLTKAIAENRKDYTLDFRLNYRDSPNFPENLKQVAPLDISDIHKYNRGRLNDIMRVMQAPENNPRGVKLTMDYLVEVWDPHLKIRFEYPKGQEGAPNE